MQDISVIKKLIERALKDSDSLNAEEMTQLFHELRNIANPVRAAEIILRKANIGSNEERQELAVLLDRSAQVLSFFIDAVENHLSG